MFLQTAYDTLNLPLIVVHLHTFEVIYINPEGKSLFGGDITGRKCHEVLNGTADICEGCTRSEELVQGGTRHTRARHLAGADRYVDTYESIIALPDRTTARLCLLVDVTEPELLRLDKETRELARRDMQHLIDIQSGFIASAKSMMSAATMDGDMIFVNQTMSETLGYTQDEILRMRISDLHSPEIARTFTEKIIPTAMSEGIWKGDNQILKKDGTNLPVRQIIFPIRNEAGEIIATATIMDDITQVLELERMNRYQIAIMDCSTNYIGVADLEGNTLYHSPGAYRMMGYEPGEASQWDMAQPHPDWYFERVVSEGIPTAMREGQWVGRGEIVDRYGRHIPIEQTIFPVFDENHQPMGAATIIHDITDKLGQEKEIDAARRMLRTIIDTAPSAIFWKDRNSRFLGANIAFARDAGFDDPNKLIGLSDYDLYPKDIADTYIAADRHAFETGQEQFYIEEPFRGADGLTHWVSTSKVLIHDENNEPNVLLGIYDDITKSKLNEMKLEEAIKEATEASRAKSDFLSRMSHEIRTPMNAIIGMTRIGQSAKDVSKMRYCLEKIDGASKHLLGLINDILDMSKIEANKLELVEERFDFEKMLESICNVINVKAEEKQQILLIDIDAHVPAEIDADEMRISQVITNLLSNAVKFTPEAGTIRLSVKSEGETDDGRIKLTVSVADNGIGLTEEQMGKLFRSFEQAETGTSRKYGGTGLGLAISKKIVELMDGTIGVTSQIGLGSTFTFTVLVKKIRESIRKTYDLSAYRDLRILVVDDAPEILEYFSRVLSNFNITCSLTDHGEKAIELVMQSIRENNPYHILFIDYMMEGMDGIETTRRIKQLTGSSTNVIMVSHTEWTAIEEDARQAGVDKFISKPLFQSPILDCINQLVFHTLAVERVSDNSGIFQGIKMLLAEDIAINREIVLSLLEETGIEIDCAENGQLAVEMFRDNQGKYNIIVMDVQMPVMDGLDATRGIRALGTHAAEHIPIIAMTANAFAEDVEACKKSGMTDHIGKPIDIDLLIAKLSEYCLLKAEA